MHRPPANPFDLTLLDDEAAGPTEAGPTEAGGHDPGRYDDSEVIGRGGMGVVVAAWDRRLRRMVAVKTLRHDHGGDNSVPERFIREAQITAQLEHPNIVPVYDLGITEDGRPFYTMKRVRGQSLATLGRADLSELRRLQIFLQVCDAIAFAHSQKVLHRDLKPANVMVGDYGEVLVLDWGIAKRVGDRDASGRARPAPGGDPELTRDDALIGTPTWMSPEQALGDPATAASDQYSLGAILYTLLTGEPPFRMRPDVLQRVVKGEFPPPREVRPDLSPELEAVCLRAMRVRPSDRYPSVRALRDDVQAWLEGRELRAVAYTGWRRARKFAERNRAAIGPAAIVALAATVLLVAASVTTLTAYVVTVRDQEARTAAAERRARLDVADRDVTLALLHADAGLDTAARADLVRAMETYAATGEVVPRKARFAAAWIEHRLPSPVMRWDATNAPIEGVWPSPAGTDIVYLASDGAAYRVDPRDGSTVASARVPQPMSWIDAGWAEGGPRVTWRAPADGDAWVVHTAQWTTDGLTPAVHITAGTPTFEVRTVSGRVFVETGAGVSGYDATTGLPVTPLLADASLQAVSDDGSRVAGGLRSSSGGAAVGVWDTATGALLYREESAAELVLSPRGDALLTVRRDGIALIDLAARRERWSRAAPAPSAEFVADHVYTREGDLLTERSVATGEAQGTWTLPAARRYETIRPLPGLGMYATGGRRPALYSWLPPVDHDLEGGEGARRPVSTLRASTDGVLVAVAPGVPGGPVRVLDARSGRRVASFVSAPAGTRDLALSPDGSKLAAADRDGHLRVWTLSGQPVAEHAEARGPVNGVDWGRAALVASFDDGTVGVYGPDGAERVGVLEGALRSAWGVRLSPDGRSVVATGRADGDAAWALWDLPSLTLTRRDTSMPGPAYGADWSADGRRFAVATSSGTVGVYPADGATPPTLLEHDGASLGAAFAADGTIAASNDADVTMWWPGDAAPFGTITSAGGESSHLVFQGRTLYMASDEPRITRVSLDPPPPISLSFGVAAPDRARDLALAAALLRHRRWADAERLYARWPDDAPLADRAAALAALGRVDEARALQPRLQADGVLPGTLDVWLR